jgi:predicted component of type VI protein secretion system
MTARLVVTEGPSAGREIEIDHEVVIGREGVAFTLDDSELSRRHVVIRRVGGGYEVEDLGSLNGTYVNGTKIAAPTRLAGGDTLKLGRTVIRLEAERAAATVASPVPAGAAAAAPAAAAAAAVEDLASLDRAPSAPFGSYAAPAGSGRRRGIASRQLGPMLASYAAVAGTAIALAAYFAEHR